MTDLATLVREAAEVRAYAAPVGLLAVADRLVLEGVDVATARERIDEARWHEARAWFGVRRGDEETSR